VSGDIVGRPAGAVLIPPQAARFAALTGADPDRLVLNVTGWNKLVLLGPDRVFLFPRAAAGVEWFERELAVYRADGGRLTGVLDWETARIDHPFWDFDFGEWGTGLWRRHRRDFSALWAQGWHAYAQVRGLDTDPRPLETAFRLRHALALLTDPGDPSVSGTPEEHLAHL
jgi:hypothetical protein